MKFTLSWLKEYLDTDATLDEISHTLTAIGLEVEEVVDKAQELDDFIVAEVLEAQPHPNADKLRVCKVNNGTETLQIVCGAPNARAGIKVALAQVGTWIPNGNFKIKKSKIRDVESCGMMCSADELNLGTDAAGIIELPEQAVVGDKIAAYVGADDPVIEIAITPNRSDALGVYGIARDLAAAGLGNLVPLSSCGTQSVSTGFMDSAQPKGSQNDDALQDEFQNILDQGSFASSTNVSIENQDKAPFFIGRTFKNVKNGASPAWLKQRLESIGLKPISALVDITNYLTFAFGRPAHVYDVAKLKGDLTVREAKSGEKITALDEKEYTLEAGMTIIADEKNPVAIGGIIGGLESGVSEETQDIFLEIALFDPIAVAETGRKLQIDSDARYRFERGVSAATLKHFITASNLIVELCGGEKVEVSKPVVAGSIPMERVQIAFNPQRVGELIGMDVSKAECSTILQALGFTVEDKGEALQLGVPSFRPDVTMETDVVEEIARIYGYDKIPVAELPTITARNAALEPSVRRLSEARRVLAASGLHEALTFSFMSQKDAELFSSGQKLVELSNPISNDLKYMAPSVLPNLINALGRNIARGFTDVALFEVSGVFKSHQPEEYEQVISALRSGDKIGRNTHDATRKVDVFDIKADLFAALAVYNMDEEKVQITRDVPGYFHPGRSGAVKQGKNVIAYFGQIHPGVAKQMDIKQDVVAFELLVDRLPQARPKKSFSKGKLELSNFQSVERDFAFIVNDNVPAGDIVQAVKKAERQLLDSVQVFDVYSGKGVEEGKKSVALSVKLQPKDRTLTDEEIEKVASTIITNVEKSVGGVLR